ncbi:MAG TPA: hypothetical protein VD929_04375 [Caulobacteraceae bacterium]|nr:hypothetical protein [Caulobacteraceae bacterium]
MAYDPRIVEFANIAQRRHAELIAEANQRRTREGRLEIADRLNGVRREFMGTALAYLGLTMPLELKALASENHALVISINDDFEDTISQLRALVNQETLAKQIRLLDVNVLGGGGGSPLDPPKGWVTVLVVVAVIVVALSFRK